MNTSISLRAVDLSSLALLLVIAACSSGKIAKGPPASGPDGGAYVPSGPPGPPGCGLDSAAFCDTFDNASSPQLDNTLWSIGRTGMNQVPSQQMFSEVVAGTATRCGQTANNIYPPDDVLLCQEDGGNRAAYVTVTDTQGFAWTSLRPRRPFDFTGRTGKIVFDVDGLQQTPVGHGFWFEVWLSDEPVPAPYQGAAGFYMFPKNGLGLNFSNTCGVIDASLNGVAEVTVIQNYNVIHDYGPADGEPLNAQVNDCFSTTPGVRNHFEIRLSVDQIEIWASNAGDPSSFRQVFLLQNPGISFSRGFINFQQSHYNAAKGGLTPWQTISWDNIGFDGPVLPYARAYAGPEPRTPGHLYSYDVYPFFGPAYTIDNVPSINMGYAFSSAYAQSNSSGYTLETESASQWFEYLPNLPFNNVDLTGATSAAFTAIVSNYTSTSNVEWQWNGGAWKTVPYPFPDDDTRKRPVLWAVDLADLVPGTNTVNFRSNSEITVDNMELQLSTQ